MKGMGPMNRTARIGDPLGTSVTRESHFLNHATLSGHVYCSGRSDFRGLIGAVGYD